MTMDTTHWTTVPVVALPTPAAPPVTLRPFVQAMTPIRVPKTLALPTPVRKSTNFAWLSVLSIYAAYGISRTVTEMKSDELLALVSLDLHTALETE